MTDITMPSLSDGMEEGTIIKWLVEDGQPVAQGEDLLDIETDKATTTWEAEASGVLSIVEPEGSTVGVGTVIARIGVAAAEADGAQAPDAGDPAAADAAAVPFASRAGATVTPSAGAPSAAGKTAANGVAATPLARRVARVHSVALEGITGTGPRGRVTKADVFAAAGIVVPEQLGAASAPAAPAATAAPVSAAQSATRSDGAKGEPEVRELSRLQQGTARRMAEAKATVPHFQVQTDVVMDEAIAIRAQLKELAHAGEPVPSFNDVIVRAAALALRRHPLVNGSYVDGRFFLYPNVNIGIAVATDDGLLVPTIRDADARSLGEIAREARRLASVVRDGSVTAPDLAGATFTVSNLGMYGMTAITPVVNPPQAAILGVGTMRETLARDEERNIVDRTLLTLTLSCDHRILNGADASRFLADVRSLVEQPLRLAL